MEIKKFYVLKNKLKKKDNKWFFTGEKTDSISGKNISCAKNSCKMGKHNNRQ